MKYRALGNSDVAVEDEENRVLSYTFSDETVDRYGDIIRVSGWRNLKDFVSKGPALLFAHDYRAPNIGKVLGVSTKFRGKNAIGGPVKFTSEEEYPFGYTIYKLSKPPESYMRTVSVGFNPDEQKVRIPTEEERADLGMGKFGVIYEGQDLVEVSVVPVPANPNAVQEAYQRGLISDKEQTWVHNFYDDLERRFGIDFLRAQKDGEKRDGAEVVLSATIKKAMQEILSSCEFAGVAVSLRELREQISALSEKIEKREGGDGNGRPGSPGGDAKGEPEEGADLYGRLLESVETVAKAVSEVRDETKPSV